ncbi:hypothetical protein [Pedobacter heparinus]|uniref:hypothetical protein n=1 Tax=Pedobacter heparinus TaxID=984 RepID=UPI0029317369|nr:hypothetical protein [Pedobacter heparinus]
MNLIAAHSSGIKTRVIMAIMIMGMLLNSCEKDKFNVPLNVGTIRFAANAYTIENNTVDPLTIVLPLSLPLEEEATVIISIDGQSTIAADEYTISPAIPAEGLTLKLPKGATEVSFQLSSLNNFEGEKTLVLKLGSALGGIAVANTNASSSINIKGNPIIIPEVKTSESGIAFGSVVTGTISTSKSYVLIGVKLTADVQVSATANFQVSLDDNTFSNTLTIPFAVANAAPITIHTRFNANTGVNQTITGSISHSSGTVPDATVTLTGIEYGVAAPGILIMKEDFSYGATAGNLTTLGSANWSAFSGAGVSPIKYVTPGLTLAGYVGSGVGGAAISENGSGSREDASRNFTAVNSGVIYTSHLINIASAPATAGGDFYLSWRDPAAAYFNRIYVKDVSGKLNIGVGKSSATTAFSATAYDFGTTYLLVSKYDFNTGVSSIYVLSGAPGLIEPPTADATTSTGSGPSSLVNIMFRQNTGVLKATTDGIRVATSWKEAVGL